MTSPLEMYTLQTRNWIESFVIKYNLCPFAKREMDKGTVRITSSPAFSNQSALNDLKTEFQLLESNADIQTTFIVFPYYFHNFFDYLDFTNQAESLLISKGFDGIYQLATFHPHYCFADADFDDVTNYTNRSPYPMLHLLREDSVEKAIEFYGNTELIPENNKACLIQLGLLEIETILHKSSCTD